jgi:hypothetical protein
MHRASAIAARIKLSSCQFFREPRMIFMDTGAEHALLAAAKMAYEHMEPFGESKHVVSVLALAIAKAEGSEAHDMFRIFDKLGGEKKSLDIIEKAEGKRPSGYVHELWRKQRRIPAIRAVLLLDECKRRGIAATYAEDCVASADTRSSISRKEKQQ